jgi:sugar/nucleoside kinase (ribokinase family)
MIVGFGENSIDHVYRLPHYPQPGGGGSKVAIERHDVRPGGQVATALATCARLGLPTRYVGVFGNDDNGRLIRGALDRRGVDTRSALVRPAANRYAVILLDSARGERLVLWQRDARLALAAEALDASWLDGASLLHVDATDEEAAVALARLARARGLPVTCDLDRVTPRTAALLESVTIPILAEHLPLELTGEADHERALRALRPHAGRVVVTLGAGGAAMLDDGRFLRVPGLPVTVLDSTGAGDVFRGAFIYALLRGDSPDAILRFANAAAAVSCTREGAMDSVPALADVQRLAT